MSTTGVTERGQIPRVRGSFRRRSCRRTRRPSRRATRRPNPYPLPLTTGTRPSTELATLRHVATPECGADRQPHDPTTVLASGARFRPRGEARDDRRDRAVPEHALPDAPSVGDVGRERTDVGEQAGGGDPADPLRHERADRDERPPDAPDGRRQRSAARRRDGRASPAANAAAGGRRGACGSSARRRPDRERRRRRRGARRARNAHAAAVHPFDTHRGEGSRDGAARAARRTCRTRRAGASGRRHVRSRSVPDGRGRFVPAPPSAARRAARRDRRPRRSAVARRTRRSASKACDAHDDRRTGDVADPRAGADAGRRAPEVERRRLARPMHPRCDEADLRVVEVVEQRLEPDRRAGRRRRRRTRSAGCRRRNVPRCAPRAGPRLAGRRSAAPTSGGTEPSSITIRPSRRHRAAELWRDDRDVVRG